MEVDWEADSEAELKEANAIEVVDVDNSESLEVEVRMEVEGPAEVTKGPPVEIERLAEVESEEVEAIEHVGEEVKPEEVKVEELAAEAGEELAAGAGELIDGVKNHQSCISFLDGVLKNGGVNRLSYSLTFLRFLIAVETLHPVLAVTLHLHALRQVPIHRTAFVD